MERVAPTSVGLNMMRSDVPSFALPKRSAALPVEIHMKIASLLSVPELRSLVRTCKTLHDIGSLFLYHTVEVTEKNAAQCLPALLLRLRPGSASHKRFPPVFTVRTLIYESSSFEDDLRFFPLLCDVLMYARDLRFLHINICGDGWGTLTALLKRRGLARTSVSPASAAFQFDRSRSSPYTMPRLSALRVANVDTLCALAKFRSLRAIILDDETSRPEIISALDRLGSDPWASRIEAFTCCAQLEDLAGVIRAVGHSFSRLSYLGVHVPMYPEMAQRDTLRAIEISLQEIACGKFLLPEMSVFSVDSRWCIYAISGFLFDAQFHRRWHTGDCFVKNSAMSVGKHSSMITKSFPIDVGTYIGARYKVERHIGSGASAVVMRACDRTSLLRVAVKITATDSIVLREKFIHEEAMYRRLIRKSSPCINGDHEGFRYIVFECGGMDLQTLIERREFHPLPRRHLREIAIQLLRGLQFLHSHSIAHTDIKPDNIVLRSSRAVNLRRMRQDDFFVDKLELVSVELLITDLGEAQLLESPGRGRVGANSYRAPEVTIGLSWSFAIDTFGAGCVLAELYLGRALFPYNENDLVRLALLERVLGPFPTSIAKRADRFRPGIFLIDVPVRLQYSIGEQDEHSARQILTAKPLSALIYDNEYFEMCSRLMHLDPHRRENVRECYSLGFLLGEDDDIMLSPFALSVY
ncbi:kinase-like protein [Trametes cingulata]|nr:kinase-like protein [Trametes cingulata]